MPVTHPFVNPKADGADATIARPSDWNANHTGVIDDTMHGARGASLHTDSHAQSHAMTSADHTGTIDDTKHGSRGSALHSDSHSHAGIDQMPNELLNADMGIRTSLVLAMPEVFADLNGAVKVDAGAAGSVASNIFTQGAANNHYAWCNQSFVWRDGRISVSFKAVSTTGTYELRWRIDANNYITVRQNNGTFRITKVIGGATTEVSSVAQALTLNRWYWLELDKQGTTISALLLDTGGTTPGVLKSASTLLQPLTGTVSDAGVQTGAHLSITSDQAAAQWGGVATVNGGLYAEIWGPESYAISFGGTLGGQAFGFDEVADAGALTVQWAPTTYIPATSRTMTVQQDSPDGGMLNSTSYVASYYEKCSGLGGSGVMVRGSLIEQNSAQATQATTNIDDAAETSWTRKVTGSAVTTNAATRRFRWQYLINPSSTRTGTVRFMLAQIEQGATVPTAFHRSASDNEFIVRIVGWRTVTFTSAALAAIDSRQLGINLFLPWDATIDVHFTTEYSFSATGQRGGLDIQIDGVSFTSAEGVITQSIHAPGAAGIDASIAATVATRAAAGKHRIDAKASIAGGATLTIGTGSYQKMALVVKRR